MQDPELAVEEIERARGSCASFRCWCWPMGEAPLGRRAYWPIYAAAERHGLPSASTPAARSAMPTTANGWPSYYLEDYVDAVARLPGAACCSLVAEGVFTKFPGLTRGADLNPASPGCRSSCGGSERPGGRCGPRCPGSIARRPRSSATHVRLTLQPTDAPPDPRQIGRRSSEQIGSDEFLLFSTDYPHWQFDGDEALPAGLSAALMPQACWWTIRWRPIPGCRRPWHELRHLLDRAVPPADPAWR